MLDAEPGGPPRPAAATPAERPGRRVGIERLVLILIALTSALSLVSYRFHFLVRNYDTFIIKQVIPASGLQGWLGRAFGYDPAAYDEQWRATLGSPYFPEFEQPARELRDATASDYLGIWYFTREIVRGRNPYATLQGRVTVRLENDPGLPDQILGLLAYPPMGPILILPFYLPNYFASLALYLAALHAFVVWLAYLLVKKSSGYRLPAALLALTLFLTSYPLGFLVDRGNIEGAVFILTSLGLLAYARGRFMTAAVLFGLAASGKVVPAVFLALFLLDGRFKALVVSILVAGGATLAAMLAMHEPLGSLVPQILENLTAVKQLVTSGAHPGRHFDHSFFSLLKGALFTCFPDYRASHLAGRLAPYYSLGILGSTAVILVLLRWAPFVNRVLVLTILMLVFPQISGDYKLIHLYVPLAMIFLGAVSRGWATPAEAATLAILGIIVSPKSYQFGGYSFGYYLDGVLLGVLILVGLVVRFGGPVTEEARPVASPA
jgi:hypothetical protein